MKYRLIGIVATFFLLAAAFVATAFDNENPNNRVHQHLTARQPDAAGNTWRASVGGRHVSGTKRVRRL